MGLVSGGEYEVERGNLRDGEIIECFSDDNGPMEIEKLKFK